jgi:hypothetical protein
MASYKVNNIINQLRPYIIQWGNGFVDDIFQAGSSAKGTAIKGKSDCDVFISIKHSCVNPIEEVFDSLFSHLQSWLGTSNVRKQNVSIGLNRPGYNVDLVPGKLQPGNTNYHWIYKSKSDTHTQTNVKGQVKYICDSKRAPFIKLAKIWRDCHRLEFPSVNIELAVIEAINGRSFNISLEKGFEIILNYFCENLKSTRLVDPFNTNNVISDDMTIQEKLEVAKCAKDCLSKQWSNVVW